MTLLRRFWHELQPSRSDGVRDFIALCCAVQGLRLLPHITAQPVNILPSELYGALMLLMSLALLSTRGCIKRASYVGRIIAILVACFWLLLAFDVWEANISMALSIVFALEIANEARFRDC